MIYSLRTSFFALTYVVGALRLGTIRIQPARQFSPSRREENDLVAFPSRQEEEINGMDKIRNIGARSSGLQHVPRIRTADRPERSNPPLQLRIESHFPGLL